MADEPKARSSRLAVLSIEPAQKAPHLLVLKLGTSRLNCNLELDHPDFAINGGRLNATHVLDRWRTELARLSAGDLAVGLLPFNFSDECTGWLQVRPIGDGLVEVQAGWSRMGQYDLDPSDVLAVGLRVADFEPVHNARIERPLDHVVAAVEAAREGLIESGYPQDTANSG